MSSSLPLPSLLTKNRGMYNSKFVSVFFFLSSVLPVQKRVTSIEVPMDNPKVFILYSADHDLHNDCIRKLATYLHRVCNCKIKLDMWDTTQIGDKKVWLWSEITNADKVLIIFSKGTLHKWQASMQQRPVDDSTCGEYGDMFLPGYKLASDEFEKNPSLLRTKYVAAHMEYSEKTDILPEMRNTAIYDIPNNLEQLYLRLHDIPAHSPQSSRRVQHLQPHMYISSPEGAALYNAIEAMKALIREKPNWYELGKFRRIDSDNGYNSIPNEGSPIQENDPMMNNFFGQGGGSSESIDKFTDVYQAVSHNPGDSGCFTGTNMDMRWPYVEDNIPGRSFEAEFDTDIATAMKGSSICHSDTESTSSVGDLQEKHRLMTLDSTDVEIYQHPSHISRMDSGYDFMSDYNLVSQPLMKDGTLGTSV